MAGHPAGDRVDRVVDLDAALAEHVDQLAQRVLGLGHREAVAGDDDHAVGVRQQDRDVLGAGATSPAGRRPRRAPSVEPPLSAPNRMLATERPMARAISRVRNVPEAPTSVPATSSSDVGEHVAAGGDGQAGEGVEQRDHDRHVGAADRQHQQHAEQQPDQAEHDAEPHRSGRSTMSDRQRRRAAISAAPKTTGSPGKTTGREVISSCSLAKVTIEPAKDTEPTTIVNAVAARMNQLTSSAVGVDDLLVQLEQRHQRRRAAADAVEQRHHLRHLGHLHLAGAVHAAGGADRDRAAGSAGRGRGATVEERHRAGDDRGGGADAGCRCGRSSGRTGP